MATLAGRVPPEAFLMLFVGEGGKYPLPVPVDAKAGPSHVHPGGRHYEGSIGFMKGRIHECPGERNHEYANDRGSLQAAPKGGLPDPGERVEGGTKRSILSMTTPGIGKHAQVLGEIKEHQSGGRNHTQGNSPLHERREIDNSCIPEVTEDAYVHSVDSQANRRGKRRHAQSDR
jgi:hypothetical protein